MKRLDLLSDKIASLEKLNRVTPTGIRVLKTLENMAYELEVAKVLASSRDKSDYLFENIKTLLVQDNTFYSIFINNVIKALSSSEEYNYPEYKNILLSSITKENFINSLVIIRPEIQAAIRINTKILFRNDTVEEYMTAVRKLRAGLKDKNMYARSYRWREFIYRPSREGKVSYTRKNKKTGKKRRRTGKLYRSILSKRLALGGAGFWYFLNYGNTIKRDLGDGGYPYPIQKPTNFIRRSELEMTVAFNKKLSHSVPESDFGLGKFDIRTTTKTYTGGNKAIARIRDTDLTITTRISKQIKRILQLIELEAKEPLLFTEDKVGRVYDRFNLLDYQVELYKASKTKYSYRVRYKGRYFIEGSG